MNKTLKSREDTLQELGLMGEAQFLRHFIKERHGELAVGPDPFRQTGRTTLLLVDAYRHAQAGFEVHFVARHHTEAMNLQDLAKSWPGGDARIRFMGPADAGMILPGHAVLVIKDHDVS